jgi:DNA-binding protein WhiA
MSFSAQVKEELAHSFPESPCCQRAELAALARVSGSLHFSSEKNFLQISTEHPATARKIFKLSKNLGWSSSVEVRRYWRPRHYKLFLINFPLKQNDSLLLKELGFADQRQKLKDYLNPSLVARVCCRRAFLRGCFLGRGSVNRPGSSYYLEIVLDTVEAATEVQRVMARFQLVSGLRKRKENYVVYLKNAEQIGEFLRIVGAHQAVLEFENSRIWKEMRNQVNRLVNCDTANVKRVVEAGLAQVEDIKLIAEKVGLGYLSPPLREIAELRLQYPEVSLKELGKMLKRPLGKSGVNHRFRALRRIANQLRRQEE